MNLAKYIDHTILKRDAVTTEIEKVCDEAIKYGFASVCTFPIWITVLKNKLKDTDVKVCTVVGFPYGTQSIETKVFEGKDAISKGTNELDYVITVSKVHERDDAYLDRELSEIRKATEGTVIKLILETGLLTKEEIKYISKKAVDAGWDFIKTSTGIQTTGATLEDVQMMVEIAGNKAKVKASGGVRTYEEGVKYVEAGASRIGTSNGVALMEGEKVTEGY